MSKIKPGSPCFLVALADFPELIGRVVEVVGPVPTPPDEVGDWYSTRAAWSREMFGDRAMEAPRRCLRPIAGPQPEAPGNRTIIPVLRPARTS